MATLQDCMEEVVALGDAYFIRSDAPGAYRPSQWESAALLADMQAEAPGVLLDPAWTEWSTLPNGSKTCSIHYGRAGRSISHREVPGYGHLRVFEASQRRPEQTGLLGNSLDRILGS